jgi:hypothetical protein
LILLPILKLLKIPNGVLPWMMSLLLLLATVHMFLSLLPVIILWMGNHSEVLDVDDLLVTGNRSQSIQKFVDFFSSLFPKGSWSLELLLGC